MSGFENNIINALNALIRAAIHSPNFVTGVSGWSINKDGSAEFNNLTIRGTFQGINFVINSNGIFMYDPTETLGNLVVSITAKAVTGPLGESVPPGLTIGKVADVQLAMFRDPSFSTGIFKFLFNDSRFDDPLIDGAVVTGPPAFAAMLLQSPRSNTAGFQDKIQQQFNSSDGVSSSSNIIWRYVSNAGPPFIFATCDNTGFGIRACSQITATDPTTGTMANPAQSETWHDLRPLTNAFIGTVAGSPPPQYRKCADGDIQIFGLVRTPPAAGNYNGVVWGTLNAGYRPNKLIRAFAANVADGAATPVMTIAATGTLVFNYLPAALAQTDIFINCRFPLDNTGIIQA